MDIGEEEKTHHVKPKQVPYEGDEVERSAPKEEPAPEKQEEKKEPAKT